MTRGRSDRNAGLRRWLGRVVWAYASVVGLWFVLRSLPGDATWFLMPVNAFAPFLFVPLVVLLPAAAALRGRAIIAGVIPPAVILLALYGRLFVPALRHDAADPEPVLTVASYNTRVFSASPDAVLALLADGGADVIALQETGPVVRDALASAATGSHPYRARHPDQDEYRMLVLSRFPLTVLDSPLLVETEGRVQALLIDVNGRQVGFYHIHMPALNVVLYRDEAGRVRSPVREVNRRQMEIARRILADIDARGLPAIVVGDLNATDQSLAHRLLSRSLSEAHEAVGWGLGHTYPAHVGSWHGLPIPPRLMRLDMLFSSPHLLALECRVARAYGESDHLPVVATFGWRE